MAAVTLQQTSADLKKSRAVLHQLTDTFQSIQSHVYSVMALSDQWGTFQNSFVSVHHSLGNHIRELEVKERETNSLRTALDNREKEVQLRQEKLEFDENSLSEGCVALEMRERDYSERVQVLELEKKRVKEWFKAAEAKERRIEERTVAVEKRERREGCREVEEREKRLEERWRAVEVREKEIDKRSEAVEVGENGINKRCIEVERREKEVEEGNRVAELRGEEMVVKEKRIDERFEEVGLREKGIDELCRVQELRDKELSEQGKGLELKEKEIDERCNVVELREAEIEQRCKAQELRDKQLYEQCKELELKEKRIDERLGELELKEKKIGERCSVVELREAKINQRWKVQELRDKQLKERREKLEVIEKHIDECLEKLRLKEKEIDERCCVAELKEKAIDERCSVAELKEKHIDECLERLKLKEKEIDERCSVAELKEKAIDERCSVAELKEKHIDECLERLKLKEKEIDERCSVAELKEKAIDERCKVVESREREIDERCKGQELREKQLNKQCKGLQLKEKHIDDRLGELELKEKKIGERSSVVELREAEINQHCKAQELRDQQLNERCKGLELKEKHIDERLGELELKEKEIDERCGVVELKEKAIDESCKVVESREREIDEQCKGQELREKQLNKRSKWLQLKETHIDGRLRELELKENQIELKNKQAEEACEELELKEKRMIEHTEEIKLKVKQISEKCGELELQEKHIHESFKSLDSKVEHINKRCEDLSLREKLISDRSKALDLKEKKIYKQCQALEVKEKEISRHAKAEELGERQRDVHIKALVLKGKKINKCFQEQECKKNEINDPCTKLELKREQLSDTSGMEKKSEQNSSLGFGEGLQSLTLKQCVTDGKALQMFLNDRVDEHRFMEEEIRDALRLSSEPGRLVLAACVGFFSPHLKNGDVMYETSAVRSSCVLLLEQLMILKHKVDKGLKKNAKKVFFLWKEKMREDGESRIVVLSFLLLIVAYGLSSIVDRDELQRLYEIVDQDRIAPRLHQELDLFKANEGSNMATAPLELTTGQQQTDKLQGTDTVASSSINHCSVIQSLCHRMDAKGLRLYIREHLIEQIISPEKILDALRYAPDPAKLLLNVVQIFNQPKATPVEKANCIFLLEQLMKLLKQQPSINSLGQVEHLVKPPSKFTLGLRKQAKKFAYIWKQTLAKKGYKLLEVYGFLQFLATYEIASLFNEDELFRLFKKCYGGHLVFRPEQNPYLCRTLGLEKRISGLIKSLVKEDRRLQAVKYICTFMMESYFPLAPLLKDHLKFTKEKSVKFRKERYNSHAAKIESARFEMRHLQDLLKYINDFELESEFTDVSLELRIEELEKQIAELNTSTTELEQMVTTEKGLKDDISINLEVDIVEIGSTKLRKKGKMNLLHPADTADTSSELFGGKKRTSSPSPSFVLPQEKRLKAGAFESPVLPNRQWPQPGPCTSGHQAHVKLDELPVSHPVTLPAVYVSSTQSGFPDNSYGASATPTPYRETQPIAPTAGICPGGIDVELKTTTAGVEQKLANERKEDLKNTFSANIEKNIVENNSTQSVKKAEKILSPAFSEIVAVSCGEKYFSSPSSSSVLPQQAKHLRPQTLESPNPPPNYPITSMNPPLPSLQPSGQHRPYTFGHVAHDGPNGLTALHPGQMPTVNGPSAHFGGPSGGSYGVTPYWGTGEFRPTAGICPSGTPVPQFRPTSGIGPGSTAASGQFRPYAGFDPGDTHAPVQFRPAAGIGLGSTPTPGQWPSAGIGPGSTPGQYRPTAGIGPGSIPGQFRPTAGSYPDGPPAPRQFWPTVGISYGGIPAPGYFDGSQVPPYRLR